MLEALRITDLGVIAAADVTFGPGLTVITGETGAGKTMLLTGLDLLLGGRPDHDRVRAGAARAFVEGEWSGLPAPAKAIAEDAGAELDDVLIVARHVVASGRSRAIAGGRTVPASVLGELGAEIVTVHGQAEQTRLRTPARQRDALDAYAGNDDALATYRSAWSRHVAALRRLTELAADGSARAAEADELRVGLAEIDRIKPVPGEDEELDAEIARLVNTEQLRAAAGTAHSALAGVDWEVPSVTDALETARREIAAATELDPTLGPVRDSLTELGYVVRDLVGELASHLDSLDGDPTRLAAAQQRRWDLAQLKRYGATIPDVLDWATKAADRLAEIGDPEAAAAAAQSELAAATTALEEAGTALSATRRTAAGHLGAGVTAELASLAMANMVVNVVVEPCEPGPSGTDTVRFDLVPHPGAQPVPITSGASGGELSRIMLAVELTLAESSQAAPDTFVFDEIDAGVGGAAAIEVGRRLARLARQYQVIVVTHLAQVAAFADTHVVVTKTPMTEDGFVTESDIKTVSGEDRVAELARMLSGTITDTARAHAAELLEQAGVGR